MAEEEARKKEVRVFSLLLKNYGSRLLRAAYCMCGSETEAEDLVQEAFLQAFKCADRFRGESKVYTWLYGILLNVVRERYRHYKPHVNIEDLPEPTSPDRRMKELTKVEVIHGAIESLDAEHASVVRMRYFDNLTVEEIAAKLGVSKGTVKSRLFYAREKIRSRKDVYQLVGVLK